jgi:hypothetical protein
MSEPRSRNMKITITVNDGKVFTFEEDLEEAKVFLDHVEREGLYDQDDLRHYPPESLTISVASIDDFSERWFSDN